jgi:hypothetical protein
MEIEDKDGNETFDIEMVTGELEIASSCIDGRINVRGVVELTDNSGAGCNVTSDKLITEQIDSVLSTVHGSGTWDVTSIAADIATIKQIETGRWKIVNNQFIIYDSDNTSTLYAFDLKDSSGDPTETDPVERYPA